MTQHVKDLPAWIALYSDDTALSKGYIYRQGSCEIPDILKRKLAEAFPMVMVSNNIDIFRIMPIDNYYAFAITQSFEPKNVRREHYRTLVILIDQSIENIPETLTNYFNWLKTEIKYFGPNLENVPKNTLPNNLFDHPFTENIKPRILNWVLNQIYLGDINLSYNFLFDSSEIKPENWSDELSLFWSSLPPKLRFKLNCLWFNEAQEFRINDINSNNIYITYVPIFQLNPNWKRILVNHPTKVIKFNDLANINNISSSKNETLLYFFRLLKKIKKDDIEESILKLYKIIDLPLTQFKDFFWLLEQFLLIQSKDNPTYLFKIFYQINVKLDTWVKNNYLNDQIRQNFLLLLEDLLCKKDISSLEDTDFVFILPQPLTNVNLKNKLSNFWAESIKNGNSFPLRKLHRSNIQSLEIMKDSIEIIKHSKFSINLLNSILITLDDYSKSTDNRKLWLNITQTLGIQAFLFLIENQVEESLTYFKKVHIWLLKEIPSLPSQWHFSILALSVLLPLDIKQLAEILKYFPSYTDNGDNLLLESLWKHFRKKIGASMFSQVFLQSGRLDLINFIKDDQNLITALLDEPPSDVLIKIYIQQLTFDPKLKYQPRNWTNLCQWLALHSSLNKFEKSLFLQKLEPFNLHFGECSSSVRSKLIYAPETYTSRTLKYFWSNAIINTLNSIEPDLQSSLISTKPSASISTHFEKWILNSIELKRFNKQQISQVRNNILPVASSKFHQDFSDLVCKKFPQFIETILNSIEEILHISSKNNKRPQLSISDQIIIKKHGSLSDKIYIANNSPELLKQISSTYQERCDLLTLLLSEIITKRGAIEFWWKKAGQKPKHFPDKDTVSEIWSAINEHIYEGTITYRNALEASWEVLQQTRDIYLKDSRKTHYSQLARLDLYHSLID